MKIFILAILIYSSSAFSSDYFKMIQAPPPEDPCYDEERAKKCIPDFVNAAFGVPVKASSVCGAKGVQTYCPNAVEGFGGGTSKACIVCDESDPKRRFPPTALTDVNNSNNVTCWRSEPIVDSNKNDNVTLILSLGKKFELTYIT